MGMSPAIKVLALLAVRLTSERLPLKALRLVGGKMTLAHILERLQLSETINDVVVCTSSEPVDDVLADTAVQLGAKCFRGEGDDVLCRLYEAARLHGATHIIRALGDNMFVCMEHLDRQMRLHAERGADWSVTENLPWGMKTEIISFSALEKAYLFAEDTCDSCDLTWYFDQPEYYDILRLEPMEGCRRPDYRMTMDTEEDLLFLRTLCTRLGRPPYEANIRDIISMLDNDPELVAINQQVPDRINDTAYKARVNTRILDTRQR